MGQQVKQLLNAQRYQEIENRWLAILQAHAQQVRVIYRKLNYGESFPPELAWAEPLGRWVILQAGEETITIIISQIQGSQVKGTVFNIPREWLHYSIHQVSHEARALLPKREEKIS